MRWLLGTATAIAQSEVGTSGTTTMVEEERPNYTPLLGLLGLLGLVGLKGRNDTRDDNDVRRLVIVAERNVPVGLLFGLRGRPILSLRSH